MTDSPTPPSVPSHRWQFTIRGMLIFTATVAVGTSVWQTKIASWTNLGIVEAEDKTEFVNSGWLGGLLILFVIWMMIGLLYQLRDLIVFSKQNPHLDHEQKNWIRVEIAWRAGIVCLLSLYALLAILLDRGFVSLLDREDSFFGGNSKLAREAIFLLLVIAIVGSVPIIRRKTKWIWPSRIVNLIAVALGLYLCQKLWFDQTTIAYLVHIATLGIDWAGPLRYSKTDILHYRSETACFYYWSLISGVCVFLNWIFLRLLVRQWSLGKFRRLLWASLLLFGVSITGGFVIWIYAFGLEKISPYMAEVGSQQPLHCWIAVALLLGILATIVAYRASAESPTSSGRAALSWRMNEDRYYHEWRTILAGFALVIPSFVIYARYQRFLLLRQMYPQYYRLAGSQTFDVGDLVATLFCDPTYYLWMCLFLLAIFRAFSRRPDPSQTLAEIPRLNPAKFIAIWLASAAFVVSGSLALVWMSFGLWFNPWFSGK